MGKGEYELVGVYRERIYAYSDTKCDSYCYVGKDSHLDENRRNYRHNHPYYYDEQPINRILQNNPTRYDYVKLVELSDVIK